MTPEQTTTILASALGEFVTQIVELALDGWELDEESPPRMVGWMHEARMWRNPTEAQRNALPKLSRAEILAKAREAKAAKAKALEEATPNDNSPY